MFCKNCGKEIPDGSKFCSECGSQVTSNTGCEEESANAQLGANRSFLKLCLILCILICVCVFSNKETREGLSNLFDTYGIDLTASMGERNALAKAKLYLETMPFSKDGLIAQLEYEGYTAAQAAYAVEHCGADWNQQAAKKGKLYLETMPFSRDGLIRQLEFDGFTHDQAVYGAEQNGY